jgi:hypothetical protein
VALLDRISHLPHAEKARYLTHKSGDNEATKDYYAMVRVVIGDAEYISIPTNGKTVDEAKQLAAQELLATSAMRPHVKAANAPKESSANSKKDYYKELLSYMTEMGMTNMPVFAYSETEEDGVKIVRCVVTKKKNKEKITFESTGKSKPEARRNASRLLYESLTTE